MLSAVIVKNISENVTNTLFFLQLCMASKLNFVYSICFKWAIEIYNFNTGCLQVKKK